MTSSVATALLREGASRLQAMGVEHARQEAEWMLSRLVGSPPLELYLCESDVPEHTAQRFLAHIDERAGGIPLQYLLGEAEFYGERFEVVPGVFIPRPETEVIVEAALQALRERERHVGRPLRLLDLGTGSGCVAVTLARHLPTCVVIGVEVSWVALRTAKRNLLRHGLEGRVHLLQGWWDAAVRGTFDGVVSNPPYVPSAQVDHLPLDVRHEPRLSLDGGPDGMGALTLIMSQAARLLEPEGILALECGETQVRVLGRHASAAPWVSTVEPLRDLAGRPRGILITHG